MWVRISPPGLRTGWNRVNPQQEWPQAKMCGWSRLGFCRCLRLAPSVSVGALLGLWLAAPAWGAQPALVADAHVNSALPTVNSGAISNLDVGGGYTALLQFDLSLLPTGTTAGQVSRAVLRLYCNRVTTPGLVSIALINGAWGEYSVTYATEPAIGSSSGVFSVSQAGAFVALDVTSLVQGWIGNPASNYGVALTAGTAMVQFDSKENDLTSHAATLDVELVDAGPTGPAGAAGTAGPQGPVGPAGTTGAPGATGPQGPIGASGPAGATGPIGPAGPAGNGTGLDYQGTFASTTNYALGAVVVFQGSSFISLIGSNYGNTPGLSPSEWGLLAAAGVNGTGGSSSPTVAVSYQGVYQSTLNYALNDIVLYGASSYISLIAGNDGNIPALSPADWGLLAEGGTGIGPAGPAGPAGATGPQGPPGLGYQGAYASSANYALSDVVEYQGSSYISLKNENVGNTPNQSPAEWGLLASAQVGATGPQGPPGFVYQGSYASTTNYSLGDVVLWQGSSYTSLIAGNHGNTPSLSPQQWGVLTAQGPAGSTGATGATGVQGPQGLPGDLGPNGPIGPQGPQGIAGQAGAQGIPGATGAQGLSGPMGPQGPAGPVGLSFQGVYSSVVNYALADGVRYNGADYVSLQASNHGNTPDQSPAYWALFAQDGATGATGPVGATGPTGPAGPIGPQGIQGFQGIQGPIGPPGMTYQGVWSNGTGYAANDAVSYNGSTYIATQGNSSNQPDNYPAVWSMLAQAGAQGLQGVAGTPGTTGATGPAGQAGSNGATGPQGPPLTFRGDWLIGTSYAVGDAVAYGGSSYSSLQTNVDREPDVSPLYWGVLAAAGATGPAGANGPQGLQGPSGTAGAAGAIGSQGPAGPVGPTGATGPAGPAGAIGPMGAAGPAGAAGANGIPGTNGANGATGAAGAVGMIFKNAWVSGYGYAVNDVVTFGNPASTYIATLSNNSAEPDTNSGDGGAWTLLAAAGGAGPTGAQGSAATVTVGTVTTGAAGSSAQITNSGTSTAAVLNFTIPQGATGPAGSGGGGGNSSGISGAAISHVEPSGGSPGLTPEYYSVNNSNAGATESSAVMTWVPLGCTVTSLNVYSQLTAQSTLTLRTLATPVSTASTLLTCTIAAGPASTDCTVPDGTQVSPGTFIDYSIVSQNGPANPGIWTALACN